MTRSTEASSTAPALDVVAALNHPKLFQPWFAGSTWGNWKTVLKATCALPMTDDEVEFFKSIAGGRNPPRRRVREAWYIVARRGGKDSIVSGVGAHAAAFFDRRDLLRPGERGVVLCLAVDRDQAAVILNYIRSYFTDIPMLRAMVTRQTKAGFELGNGIDVVVGTNSYRSVRGRPVLLAVLDECAFYRDENSSTPDTATYDAIRPALASLPGSQIIGISSPHKKAGLLWSKYRKHFGEDDDDVLVIQAPTRVLNPTIDQGFVDQALADDPIVARSEWLAEWRPDVTSYADLEIIESAVDRDVAVRPPVKGVTYRAGIDPSGGARDSFTAAIAHDEDGLAVLDCLIEIKAPLNPTSATEQIAKTLKSYDITEATGDKYAAQWVVDAFAKCGITYRHSERDRSAIYADCLPLFTSGRARLLDNQRLVNQFASLERRTSSLGRDKIDHGRGGMDDCCNAAALAMVLAAGPQRTGIPVRIAVGLAGLVSNDPIDDAEQNYQAALDASARGELKGTDVLWLKRERARRMGVTR